MTAQSRLMTVAIIPLLKSYVIVGENEVVVIELVEQISEIVTVNYTDSETPEYPVISA